MELTYKHSFTFAEEFSVWFHDGAVLIEQYNEGAFELPHIKTHEQFVQLYEVLTGNEYKGEFELI